MAAPKKLHFKRNIGIAVAVIVIMLIGVVAGFAGGFFTTGIGGSTPTPTPPSGAPLQTPTSTTIPTPTPALMPTPTPTPVAPTDQSAQGYWTLNILPTTGPNSVTPNGTIEVPMSQSGITVTATPDSQICGFVDWMFDYKIVGNTATIFIPTQQEGSNHTLEAYFANITPALSPSPTESG